MVYNLKMRTLFNGFNRSVQHVEIKIFYNVRMQSLIGFFQVRIYGEVSSGKPSVIRQFHVTFSLQLAQESKNGERRRLSFPRGTDFPQGGLNGG